MREMTMIQLKDILTEKQKLVDENCDVESRIHGRGVSDNEQKAKQFDAEREQLKKISSSLKFLKEKAT